MNRNYSLLIVAALMLCGCKKDFLDKKPVKSLLVPTNTSDFRALLDNLNVFNQSPGLGTIADGDFTVTEAGWNNYGNLQERTSYTWSADIYGFETGFDWNAMYQQIFYANIVLEGLDKLENNRENRELRGEALFARGYATLGLVQMYAAPYHAASAAKDIGIPVKLSSTVTDKVNRGTLEKTYGQVLADIKGARAMLPLTVNYKTRSSRAAAYGLLSRVYLSMEDYPSAGKYADSCLQLRSELIDYNTLNAAATRPFPQPLPNTNQEMIYYSYPLLYSYIASSSPSFMTTEFRGLFAANDLRKQVYFREVTPGNFKFKGNYTGSSAGFSGIATDEIYLTRAECAARAGNKDAAIADLNTLLVKRWKTGTFTPLSAADAEEALRLVLLERRKELAMRGIRWNDLRRLNNDPRFAVTLTRKLNGQTYSLEPNSKRYTYPLPPDELLINPMPQNER